MSSAEFGRGLIKQCDRSCIDLKNKVAFEYDRAVTESQCL